MLKMLFASLLLLASASYSQYVFHIYSPWADDPTKVNNRHHAQGGFSDWSANTKTQMVSEGNGWYSYTITGSLTDWWDITLKNCPVASDQNCNGGEEYKWNGASKPKIVSFFGGEKEIWIYPAANTVGYTTTFIPPDAKLVLFKSPWGNKALPNMIVGADTIRMRYSSDATECGWFYGPLRNAQITLGAVHFQQAFTTNTLPATSTLNIKTLLASNDSVYVDGTTSPLVGSATMGTAGTCFDSTKTVHILHPWSHDVSRGLLPVYLKAGNLLGNYKVMNNDGILLNDLRFNDWYSYSFPASTNWSQNEVLEFSSYYPNPETDRLTFKDKPAGKALFPTGVYEVWLLPVGDSLVRIYAPVSPKYIQFRNPWSNTVPKIILGDDTLRMKSIADTCGWYRIALWQQPAEWSVLFKQAIGFEIYSMAGLEDGTRIALDSLLETGDQAWITPTPYPTGSPIAGPTYQGPPGDCPNRKLAVQIFDWANSDKDFGKVWDGSDAADDGVKCPDLVKGMVDSILGPSGVPTLSATAPATCTAVRNLHNWFVPQIIKDTYTNSACRDLPLTLDDEGFWLADIAADSAKKIQGFFPVDDFTHLDIAKTIVNPKYELEGSGNNINGVIMTNHNFLFTMHVNATFEYVPGQYFEFRGDDDVWVFINNKLVVDIGGVHGPLPGYVDLDTLGLTAGETYSFHIFFAERNCCGSNFKMRTSMDLQTERTFFPVKIKTTDGTMQYQIWQIIKEQSLSCDFNSTGPTDTVLAPSTFQLYGPQFPGTYATLTAGTTYGGIIIDKNFSSFVIDTTAIVRSRLLAPGSYRLVFTNAADPSLNSEIRFVVPTYPLPSIAFVDSLGAVIDPDTVAIGEWAFQPYPVYIQAQYVGVHCETCSDELNLTTSDSLQFLDKNLKAINTVKLDSGRATVWIMGLSPLKNASFKVASPTIQNVITWKNINLKEPPVPFARLAEMHDRNGDGLGDSLYMHYSRPLKGKDTPDSLFWMWADIDHGYKGKALSTFIKDSNIIMVADSLAVKNITGGIDEFAYKGGSTSWFTYVPTEGEDMGKALPFGVSAPITDRIGAIVTEAETSPSRAIDTVFITLSENIQPDTTLKDVIFEFRIWRNGIQSAAKATLLTSQRKSTGTRYTLLFANGAPVVPGVGDSLRIIPGLGKDWSGNVAHKNNPWVRIVGKQRARIESIPLVEVDLKTAPGPKSPVTKVVRITSGQDADAILAQEGIPGHILRYDLANVIANSPLNLKPSEVELRYKTAYFTSLGGFVNQDEKVVKCTDSIFNGDCTRFPGHIFIGWNMRSDKGRLVATGAYVASLYYEVKAKNKVVDKINDKQIWGIRRK